ncbi:hypothetical protein QBZ16_001209 [Prototheca wickerhamii]|uniref:C3H1-type domain-containing protein n=1 Tax=Prototheca wickerhamii TaxID=3111 RepID=A0AAD9MH51_PROWI|nr:hypothetical protein QBZ16_001209 [Prototheca wickerhamii]
MAEHLASIFGTEKDRVNCPFYFKIGACRHGDRCSRLHNRPTISPTLLLQNMYQNPVLNAPLGADGLPLPVDPKKVQEFFEDFYEDIFEELAKFGEVEYLNVCDNLADHMVGNCYVKFRDEEDAARAQAGPARPLLRGQADRGRVFAGDRLPGGHLPAVRGGHLRPRRLLQLHARAAREQGAAQAAVRAVPRRHGRVHALPRPAARRPRGGGRYDDRPRFEDRGRRGDDRGRRYDRGGADRRDSSAERRANIARWNAEAAARAGRRLRAGRPRARAAARAGAGRLRRPARPPHLACSQPRPLRSPATSRPPTSRPRTSRRRRRLPMAMAMAAAAAGTAAEAAAAPAGAAPTRCPSPTCGPFPTSKDNEGKKGRVPL